MALAALSILKDIDAPARRQALEAFYRTWKEDDLVIDSRDEVLMIYDIEDARRGAIILRSGGSLANVFSSARR